MKPLKKRIWLIILFAIIILVFVLIITYRLSLEYRYRMAILYQMPSFAGAVHFYYEEYNSLPKNIHEIEATGLYGPVAYHLPKKGTWKWTDYSGPEVLYLPIEKWDKKSRYVIAIQPPIGNKIRRYVIFGETTAYQATEEDLKSILVHDDELREKTGQPGRWKDVPWQANTAK